ncbi:MAG TPA: M81 family metallopeptidase, partial [Myxococcota bacterium]|nr:M81 family metallopeptidase [Myxococcota bacterium]
MRVALASFQHETNTYCPEPTRFADFRVTRGGELLRRAKGTRTALGGLATGLEEIGAERVPLLAAGAQPSGTIEAGAWARLCAELELALARAGPVDALALALHGAAVAEGCDDPEGELCARLRARIGPDVPFVATFDLHGNVSQAMADALDLPFPCRAYPHVDTWERGVAAARALRPLAARAVRPVTRVERLPLLVPPTPTGAGPGAAIRARFAEAARRTGLLACEFFHGFPWADTPLAGAAVAVVADADPELAQDAARELARYVWDLRESLRPVTLSCVEAVERALGLPGRPIVVAEAGDNPGGGAPGDGTHLLRALLDADPEGACFGFIADPEVARAAHAAGIGAKLDVSLGGKRDRLHGEPLRARAEVTALSHGRVSPRAMLAGVELNLGPMARLRIGRVDVLVSSRSQQVFDPEVFRMHGIDVRRAKLVALKSAQHFRA